MRKTYLLLLILTILAVQHSWSQTIRGKIVSNQNEPIPFVNIILEGTAIGTLSDENGTFEISGVDSGTYKLKFSSLGYISAQKTISLSDGEILEFEFILSRQLLDLQETVVSASRNPESIDEVPSSFTILSRKSLDEGITITSNIIDILSHAVPGLGPSTGTSSNFGQTLRGRPLLVMIDGVPQSTPLRNGGVELRVLDPEMIDRVEVIKGATAVYGNGAAGGLVNYITRTPKNGDHFSAQTQISSGGSLSNIDNSVGSRISQLIQGREKKFDYMIGGVFEQTGEWKDAEGDVLPPTYGLGETDSYNAFLKMGYQVKDHQRLQLSYNYYTSEQKTNYGSEFGNYDLRLKTKAKLGPESGVPQGVRGNHNLNLNFSNQKAFLGGSYEADVYYQSVDNVFFYSPVFVGGGQSMISSDKKGLRFFINTPLLTSKKVSGDISYGFDLMNDITSQHLVDGRIWVPEMNMVNKAPFAQLKFNLWENLVLKGGLRAEKVDISVDDYSTLETLNTATGAIIPSFDVKGGNLDYTTFLFNSGLRYNKWKVFSPYISFSQGFSVADLGVMLRAARVNDIKDINTEAVVVNNYETGFLSEFSNFRLEGVIFMSTSELGTSGKFKDGIFEVLRAPETIYGFELVTEYAVSENLGFGLSYAFVEGKMDRNDDGDLKDPEDDYLGGERISPPKTAAFIRYSAFKERLSLRLQMTAIGRRERFEQNERGSYDTYKAPVEPYQLVDISAKYKANDKINLFLAVENLLNEDYFPARSQWFTQPSLYTKGKGAALNIGLQFNW